MPDFEAEEAALNEIVAEVNRRDELVRRYVAEDDVSNARHELDKLKAYLDAHLN